MEQDQIKNIFEKFAIEIKNFKSTTNSFNSKVYIINSINNKKYVLKFCNNEKKMINESKYMKHLNSYLPVSNVIGTGNYDNKYYIIQDFYEGKNIYDEEANELTDEQVKNIGILLAKLHSYALLDEENNSWIEYLNKCLNKSKETLEKILGKKDNDKISNFLKNYIEQKITNNYKNSILHMDFRIGNLIFEKNNNVGLIDLESMKNGEYAFDFVKLHRLFNKNKFKIFLDEYNTVKKVEDNFEERLNFYSLFDSYNSLRWCITRNQIDSNFYKLNYEIVIKYLEKLNKTGKI